MTGTKKKTNNSVQNLIGGLLVVCGILISFISFYRSNVTRITHQNEGYIADIATQRAVLVDDLFAENLSYIESAAIVLETAFQSNGVDAELLNVREEDRIDPAEVEKVAKILRKYEERFVFDHLRFIDLYGRDYTTGENVIAAVVNEREYFREGIQGKTGMNYILDSKVTSERQIGFYSPVYESGSMVGLAVGFYGEDFIRELLDLSVFEHECDVLLCAQDGTVIYSTGAEQNISNYIDEFSAFSATDERDRQNVREAFSGRGNTLFSYRVDGKPTVGCVSYVGPESDFFLVLDFPVESYSPMIRNAGMNGVILPLSLTAIFGLAGLFYMIRFILQKKQLLKETKNSNDIHFAMSRLFENFVIVDAKARTYHYIEGMPDVGHIPNDGEYDLFAEDLLKRFPNDSEREEAARLISFDHLTELMNQGNNIVSFNLHAPIREEEWFTYNYIVVSRDEEGKVTEFIIARQDITKLQEKEEETRRILERARDEAEKGNRAKSDFLSSMSHDIRTPMNAIIGYTNIAREKIDDRELVSDSLRKISASSQYLLALINDVLDMSKIESGKVQIHATDCDLKQVFERIADLTRSQASKKDLDISYDAHQIRHTAVVVDELRLEQILINIAGNAVKYTPEGGKIFITATEEEELPGEKSRYRFSVRDTGIGMSEDFLPHVFESFTRETNSTVNKIQGTGLGMAITARLVDMMGGEITVSSKLNEGSDFVVTMVLPYGKEAAGRIPDLGDAASAGDIDLRGKKILLVEDNDINAEIAELVLAEYGIKVERACNGREGVQLVAGQGDGYYDAVLMDIQMPLMNGYEATKEIRKLETAYARKLPIIAMSANAYEADIRAALDSGMDGHVAKPFDPQRLAEELYRNICRQNL